MAGKEYQRRLSEGMEVFFTAFLKQDKEKFYVCKGVVIQAPQAKERQVYKVKITSVAIHPVGGEDSYHQSSLLGKQITKKLSELSKEPPEFMKPSGWIQVVKDEQHSQ